MKNHTKNLIVYYIGYVMIKDYKYVKIKRENPLIVYIFSISSFLLIKAKKIKKNMKKCGVKSKIYLNQ